MQTIELQVSEIDVGDRLRDVDPGKAAEIAASMAEHGQLSPIEVRPAGEDGRYPLVFGAHRVAAAGIANLRAVTAIIFDGSQDEARLREIDENLYRHELTPYDQATFLAERRSIYERLNGKIKAGRKAAGNSANLAQLSFFDETTQKFALPRRTIVRALARRAKIDDQAWAKLRGTRFAQRGADLDTIAKLSRDDQRAVVRLLAAQSAHSVRDAIRMVSGAAPRSTPESFDRLLTIWSKAPQRDRTRFIEHLKSTGEF